MSSAVSPDVSLMSKSVLPHRSSKQTPGNVRQTSQDELTFFVNFLLSAL